MPFKLKNVRNGLRIGQQSLKRNRVENSARLVEWKQKLIKNQTSEASMNGNDHNE